MQNAQGAEPRIWLFSQGLGTTGTAPHLTNCSSPAQATLHSYSLPFSWWFLSIYNEPFVCKVCVSLVVQLIKLITQSLAITTTIWKTKRNKNKTTNQLWRRRQELALDGMSPRRQLKEGVGWLERALQAASFRAPLQKGNENWHAYHLGEAVCTCLLHPAERPGSEVNANKYRVDVPACARMTVIPARVTSTCS